VSQPIIQDPEHAGGTDLREYAPRKYSARESAVIMIMVFVVIVIVIALFWAGDVVSTK
jgi:hypothetical protein